MKRQGRQSLSDWWARPDGACGESPDATGADSDQECEGRSSIGRSSIAGRSSGRCDSECSSPKRCASDSAASMLCFSPAKRDKPSFFIGDDSEIHSPECESPRKKVAMSKTTMVTVNEVANYPHNICSDPALMASLKDICADYFANNVSPILKYVQQTQEQMFVQLKVIEDKSHAESCHSEVLGLRRELKGLAQSLHDERHERTSACDQLESHALSFETECCERLSQIERFSQEAHTSYVADMGTTQDCITRLDAVTQALEQAAVQQAALEVSVTNSLQVLQTDFKESLLQTNSLEVSLQELAQWSKSHKELQEDMSLFEDNCILQLQQLADNMKTSLETLECERQDRIQNVTSTKNLEFLRVEMDRARHRIEEHASTVSERLEAEVAARQDSEQSIMLLLDKLDDGSRSRSRRPGSRSTLSRASSCSSLSSQWGWSLPADSLEH